MGDGKAGQIRLNKYLSEAGLCSRREADRLIDAGKIQVDGVTASIGAKVTIGQKIEAEGRIVEAGREQDKILMAVYKPTGIVCTADAAEKNNIINYLNYPKRIFYVGRLDKDSEGLLLMTNDGDIVNKMMRSGNCHEKEYVVTVDKPVTSWFLEQMASGVPILDVITRPCKIEKNANDPKGFRIILTQGLNRQIRRMCEYCGYTVKRLIRIRIMNIRLGELKSGERRMLTKQEVKEIYRLTELSSKTTVLHEIGDS